jgi:hypothetical protein
MVGRSKNVVEVEEMCHGTRHSVVEVCAVIRDESATDAIDAEDIAI